MKIIAIMICFGGSLLLYCSHQHQSLLKRKLPKFYAGIGVILLILSIILLLLSLPKLAALYMWLMTMITVWSFLPFISLLKKNVHHEILD